MESLPVETLNSQRIRSWLLQTQLDRGKKLPSSLTIATSLGLDAAEVDLTLKAFEAEGLIKRDPNGNSVLTHEISAGDALLAASNRILVSSIIERSGHLDAGYARRIVDIEVARLAAFHCTARDIRELRQMCADLRKVRTWHEYAIHDTMFHNAVGEICGNVLLAEMATLALGVQYAHMWRGLVPDTLGPSPEFPTYAEHVALVEAMARHDEDAAGNAMRTHLQCALLRFEQMATPPAMPTETKRKPTK